MRLVLVGSRGDGHAKVVIELFAAELGSQVVGLIDDLPQNSGRRIGELSVIGGTADFPRLAGEGVEGVVLGFGAARGRGRIVEAVIGAGLRLPTLVHQRAFVAASAELGPGVQVMPGAHVGPGARVGRGCLINTGAILDHDVEVGENTVIDPGATLAGRARIGSEVEIGSGATLIPDSVIGDGAIVGAAAVVIRPVEPGETVVGVPARPLPAPGGRGSS
jgi:sugar O-acyltransferase (sialic acid O-acetyltransferase NeuD family)